MTDEPDGLSARLAEMARTRLRMRTVQDTLDAIVDQAVDIVDGCDQAGILVAERDGTIRTAAATDTVVQQSDAAQNELREGPCFDVCALTRPSKSPR